MGDNLNHAFTEQPQQPRSKWKASGLWTPGSGGDMPGWKAPEGACTECSGRGRAWVQRRRSKRLTTCPVCNGTGVKEDL